MLGKSVLRGRQLQSKVLLVPKLTRAHKGSAATTWTSIAGQRAKAQSLCSCNVSLLGGSWVAISGVVSPLIWPISRVTLLITPLMPIHEPPSSPESLDPKPKFLTPSQGFQILRCEDQTFRTHGSVHCTWKALSLPDSWCLGVLVFRFVWTDWALRSLRVLGPTTLQDLFEFRAPARCRV